MAPLKSRLAPVIGSSNSANGSAKPLPLCFSAVKKIAGSGPAEHFELLLNRKETEGQRFRRVVSVFVGGGGKMHFEDLLGSVFKI